MNSRTLFATSTIALLCFTTVIGIANDDQVFNRISSFSVAQNLPDGTEITTQTSSEIIAATEDGMTLIYTDSPLGGIGLIDISDAAAPKPGGFLDLEGEPTSVAVSGGKALIGLNTSKNYTEPSGQIVVLDIASRSVDATCDLGGQPDSVAIAKDGDKVAIAIENERDEDLNDGAMPQFPAGNVTLFSLSAGTIDCASRTVVDLTGLSKIAPFDPEPEFVDFNDIGEVVVTLQENNHLAVIDSATGSVISHFSAGSVSLTNVDLKEEGALTFDGVQPDRAREPDAVKWIDNDRFVIANEGDFQGGSRGFTIFDKDGTVAYESGMSFEYEVTMLGHYPDKRSGNKGVEPEGLEVATFGNETYIFVMAERSSIVGVYKDTGAEPELLQMLPSGVAPEGAVAIPSRGLLVTANEADLIEDNGARSHVMIYQLGQGEAAYPSIHSVMKDGRPIGWGALSGLAADPSSPGRLYAVNDSFYRSQPSIFEIDATQTPAVITDVIRVTRDAMPAMKLDLEGIAIDKGGNFWLASEGRSDRQIPHAIVMTNPSGVIKKEIPFPKELIAVEKRFGSEGITLIGEMVWIAIQREWNDDPDGFVKLVSYNLETEEWGSVRYPLEAKGKGWVGLSEITAHGDHVYIIERDNQIGGNAAMKALFRVPLSDMQPAPLGEEPPVVRKEKAHDFIPDLKATNGYVVDKIEGFAIDARGEGFAVTDNDGVDDSSGETLFFSIGKM